MENNTKSVEINSTPFSVWRSVKTSVETQKSVETGVEKKCGTLKTQILHCLVSQAMILEFCLSGPPNFFDKNTKSLIKHVYL